MTITSNPIRTSRVVFGVLLLLAATDLCARADSSNDLPANRVVAALHAVAIEATPDEIEFLTSVPASDSRTNLRVTDWRRLDQGSIWIRLACRRPQDCLPFFVLLHPDEPRTLPLHQLPASAATSVVSKKKPHAPAFVRAGSRATMIMQRGAARITAPVVCLDDGELGSKIRVSNVATKQVLTAEILDRGLVQAHF